ncbi:MAG: hypothetical protein ACK4WJ_06335 [Endomicrobiia bacterium]
MKKFYKGDTWQITYTIYDTTGQPLDLTGWQVRGELSNKTYNISVKLGSTGTGYSGITILEPKSAGKIKVNLTPSQTSILVPDIYDFEIEIKKGADLQHTVIREQFEVLEDIIRW